LSNILHVIFLQNKNFTLNIIGESNQTTDLVSKPLGLGDVCSIFNHIALVVVLFRDVVVIYEAWCDVNTNVNKNVHNMFSNTVWNTLIIIRESNLRSPDHTSGE
jgi:hypothetical protein